MPVAGEDTRTEEDKKFDSYLDQVAACLDDFAKPSKGIPPTALSEEQCMKIAELRMHVVNARNKLSGLRSDLREADAAIKRALAVVENQQGELKITRKALSDKENECFVLTAERDLVSQAFAGFVMKEAKGMLSSIEDRIHSYLGEPSLGQKGDRAVLGPLAVRKVICKVMKKGAEAAIGAYFTEKEKKK